MLTLTKLNNFKLNNCFILIVNFHNRFVMALTEIFQFCRALAKIIPSPFSRFSTILHIDSKSIYSFVWVRFFSSSKLFLLTWSCGDLLLGPPFCSSSLYVIIISLCYTFCHQYTTAASFIFGLTLPIWTSRSFGTSASTRLKTYQYIHTFIYINIDRWKVGIF